MVVDRTDLEIVDRRAPTDAEAATIPTAAWCCAAAHRRAWWSWRWPPGVLTGFLSWLEATPPGRTGYRQAS